MLGGGGYINIVACGGKGLVGVEGDEQEEAGRDGVGREAEEEELLPTGTSSCGARRGVDVRGNGIVAASKHKPQPAATAAGEAAQSVGIAGHTVGSVAKAERLPHKPKATDDTQGYHSIGDGKDEDCDIKGCEFRQSGVPQEACRQSEDEETEDEQVAVGLTAELELRKTVAFNHRTDLFRGERWYPRGDVIH